MTPKVSSDIVMTLALGMGVLGLYTHYVWYFMGAALLVFMAVMTPDSEKDARARRHISEAEPQSDDPSPSALHRKLCFRGTLGAERRL